MKVGCVIQGDIRRGSEYVLREFPAIFDFTVLSTWKNDESKIPKGQFSVILNNKPPAAGISNRNYQRLTTARGVDAAKAAGCDYVLKWRTDMFPSRLDVNQLIEWAGYNVPRGMKSRIVMPAFRNLSVEQDWFSSTPDLFAFAHIHEMKLLWGDSNFDYSSDINVPEQMFAELNLRGTPENMLADLYPAESELYAIYKSRLQSNFSGQLTHREIAYNYFRLIDHRRLGIFWFDKTRGFRAINQAWEHPWWTESNWHDGRAKLVPAGYPVTGISRKVRKTISPFRVRLEEVLQSIAWRCRSS